MRSRPRSLGLRAGGFGLALALGGGCAGNAAERPEFFAPVANPDAPYSEAVRAGSTLFLAGKLGIDPATGQLAPGGIQPETRQALTSIRDVLERHGAGLVDVVKCTVFLADIDEWAAMNEVYREFFPRDPPARSAVGVSGLGREARVEIECIAMMR
ncbi:MAG: Rid family detoxifying hydrolase [Myxococcota bacterium]